MEKKFKNTICIKKMYVHDQKCEQNYVEKKKIRNRKYYIIALYKYERIKLVKKYYYFDLVKKKMCISEIYI